MLTPSELKHEAKNLFRKALKAARGLVALLLAVLAVEIWGSSTGRLLEIEILRSDFALRGKRAAPSSLLIIGIDDQSMRALGLEPRSALPRRYFANAIEQLAASNPKLVIIDASFPTEDFDPDANARIARALASMPTTIGAGTMNTGLEDNPYITIPSDPQFRTVAKYELPMMFTVRDGVISQLTADSQAKSSLKERAPLAPPLIEFGGFNVATPGPYDLINFYGPAGTINRLSLFELISPNNPDTLRQQIEGKVVFIGYQTVANNDRTMDKEEFMTSVSHRPMFGVEAHANVGGNLIDGSAIRRFDILTEVQLIFFGTIAIALIGLYISPERAVWIITALVGALIFGHYFAFTYLRWLPGVPVLAFIAVLSLLLGVVYRLGQRERFRRFIARIFGIRV